MAGRNGGFAIVADLGEVAVVSEHIGADHQRMAGPLVHFHVSVEQLQKSRLQSAAGVVAIGERKNGEVVMRETLPEEIECRVGKVFVRGAKIGYGLVDCLELDAAEAAASQR